MKPKIQNPEDSKRGNSFSLELKETAGNGQNSYTQVKSSSNSRIRHPSKTLDRKLDQVYPSHLGRESKNVYHYNSQVANLQTIGLMDMVQPEPSRDQIKPASKTNEGDSLRASSSGKSLPGARPKEPFNEKRA